MSEKVELKPCPQCQKCGAEIIAAHRSKNIKIEAIEAWNRRTRHDD